MNVLPSLPHVEWSTLSNFGKPGENPDIGDEIPIQTPIKPGSIYSIHHNQALMTIVTKKNAWNNFSFLLAK
jgi:hypothetical protein